MPPVPSMFVHVFLYFPLNFLSQVLSQSGQKRNFCSKVEREERRTMNTPSFLLFRQARSVILFRSIPLSPCLFVCFESHIARFIHNKSSAFHLCMSLPLSTWFSCYQCLLETCWFVLFFLSMLTACSLLISLLSLSLFSLLSFYTTQRWSLAAKHASPLLSLPFSTPNTPPVFAFILSFFAPTYVLLE